MADYFKKMLSKGKAAVAENVAKSNKTSRLYAGDPSLDWCIGGWSKNRINLIYGPSKSGKSAITVMAAASLQQKEGGWVIIYDTEYYYLDEAKQAERLGTFGLDLEKTLVVSSNRIGELFYGLADLEEDIKKKKMKVTAIVVDSWGGIQSDGAEAKIAKNEAEDAGNSFGGNAKYMNPILGQLLRICAENEVTLFAVQHCIKNMEKYGDKWVLLGGERLRFLANSIVFVEGSIAKTAKLLAGEVILEQKDKYSNEIMVGKKILGRCEKSRSVVEGRKVEFWVNFAECRYAKPELSLYTLATNLGVIGHPISDTGKVNKMWWQYPVGETGLKLQGKNMIEALKDKDLFKMVYDDCMASTRTMASSEDISEVVQLEDEEGGLSEDGESNAVGEL